MVSTTGTAVLARSAWSNPAGRDQSAAAPPPAAIDRRPRGSIDTVDTADTGCAGSLPPNGDGTERPSGARTAAGARAMRRRRARLAADRRPPSGVLPSSPRRSAVVAADRGDEVDDRHYPVGRWLRLACTLCFTATAVLVAVVLLSTSDTQVVGPVVVQPGDTLWSVAQRADPAADPRAVVDRIKELNGLQGDAVVAGAVLQVPVSTP